MPPASQVAVGGSTSNVLLLRNGALYTWGGNASGQGGAGNTSSRPSPSQILAGQNFTSVTKGHSHVVALRDDGTVWAWGLNANGQLGTGNRTNSPTPVQIVIPLP